MARPRKIDRRSKLKGLAEEQRALIASWLQEDGLASCLQRLQSELGISVGQSTLYEALAFWRSEERFHAFRDIAVSQAELEAEAKGGLTAEQMEAAVDRNFLGLAAQTQDTELYREIRKLRISHETARSNARIAEAKLTQGDAKIAQKNADLKLAERRVKLLEEKARKALETVENSQLSDAQKAARIREIFQR
jgi:NACalpha-BTF3-like transcription factor